MFLIDYTLGRGSTAIINNYVELFDIDAKVETKKF